MRKLFVTLLVACTTMVAGLAPATAANNRAGDSLVNVQVGDITVLVPVSVAANLCDIDVNVLSDQVESGDTTCDATAESIATPGDGSEGSRNIGGNSLVNVQIGDITALIPIAVAANVCDVAVNVLARQLGTGEATCDAVSTSTA
jgi:hypothetical protein